MHILALSDIHRAYDNAVRILTAESEYDIIVIAGDITTFGTPREAVDALNRIFLKGRPVFAVAGNMDSPEIDHSIAALGISLNGKGVIVNDVGFFGISAAPLSPLHTPYEIPEEEILRIAEAGWKDVAHARWKILVSHPPPFDTALDRITSGAHVGSKSVRTFIERRKPDLVICGHIHEARGEDIIGSTRLINCGAASSGYYARIEIGDTIIAENLG